jgi:muconate cycloisomerase
MQHVKLKVGTSRDLQILKRARERLGWERDLRVDANCAWDAPEAIRRIRKMAPYGISAVEQPVAKEDFLGLKQVSEEVDIPIIADESLCSEEDARRLIELKACRIFNLRLSKCGGLGAARRLRQMAEAHGIVCQLGCHVGETSILSAAGRAFALCSPHLAYVEGSLAPFLLTKDPATPPVVFSPGGVGEALPGPGLGVEVAEGVLQDLARARYTVS